MKILILKLENKCFNIEETIWLKDDKKIYSENNKISQDTKLNRCICRPNLQNRIIASSTGYLKKKKNNTHCTFVIDPNVGQTNLIQNTMASLVLTFWIPCVPHLLLPGTFWHLLAELTCDLTLHRHFAGIYSLTQHRIGLGWFFFQFYNYWILPV